MNRSDSIEGKVLKFYGASFTYFHSFRVKNLNKILDNAPDAKVEDIFQNDDINMRETFFS